MKNIHLLPTDKPSRLVKNGNNKLYFTIQTLPLDEDIYCYPQNIYITSNEEIKERDYGLDTFHKEIRKFRNKNFVSKYDKKIILTTNQDLIKDGVQAIDDTFLEWFVNNPSCESVEIDLDYDSKLRIINGKNFGYYSAIIPQEEPKQETLEEAIEKEVKFLSPFEDDALWKKGAEFGANWQAEQDNNKFSEKVETLWVRYRKTTNNEDAWSFKEWLVEQFKNK
jgi:hypothetical protein